MGPIHETHVSEPGLFVVDVAAADDATALAFQQLLADRWATATAEQSTRDAGQAAYGCAATWTCASSSLRPPWSARPWSRSRFRWGGVGGWCGRTRPGVGSGACLGLLGWSEGGGERSPRCVSVNRDFTAVIVTRVFWNDVAGRGRFDVRSQLTYGLAREDGEGQEVV
ncbi:DUF6207 family protein [Streptomyces sp. FXY-T5]|uniref:DUF6207 family protein n=1 Tax=Streptomyces sp. FXY-T5 TaxID=3064901 RepID=UPI0027D2370A|nr:DUF6207 family protein [Streptomyces sp. FXY-T5]WMD06378.1 DUF6207 family protein [Streptomyces sp. FXY-T5]